MTRIKTLEKKILEARDQYYNGEPKVSDAVFDAWVDELKTLDPSNKVVVMVGAPLRPTEWKKAKHQIPMGSLDKVNTPEEFKQWVDDNAAGEELFVSEKLDGLSIELVYEDSRLVQALTRGDAETGEEILANVINMNGVVSHLKDVSFTGSFRGEIILTKTNHQKHFPDKANPRNAASGISKRLDGVGSNYLDVLLYQVVGNIDFKTESEQFKFLQRLGCKTPNYRTVVLSKKVKTAYDGVLEMWQTYQDKVRETLDYDIDGLVIRLNDIAKQLALGDKDMRPKGAIAWKFANEGRETVIRDFIWQVGNSGRITPVAVIDPVVLVGAEVERASVYNVAYINELGLDVGAKVLAVRANDVIPRVEEVIESTGTVAKPPTTCPSCGSILVMMGENLMCLNRSECPDQIVGRVKNWVKELNILELGDVLVEKLVAADLVSTPADLYKLTVDDLASLDRMGEKSAQNVYNSLWKNNPVSLDMFLGGLSIPLMGSTMFKLIMDAGFDSIGAIRKMTLDDCAGIKGLGVVKSASLIDGLADSSEIIDELLANGVKIKEKVMGKLTGKIFVFTGALGMKRAEAEQMVVDNGGQVKNSVGKTTTHLVIADPNSTSSKAVAARKMGITLLSEADFMALFE